MTSDENIERCPICSGTGWELVEGKGVRMCECQWVERTNARLARARIPGRYKDSTLESFYIGADSGPDLKRALDYTKKFVEEYPIVSGGLLYYGDIGVGKTHLAIAALKALIHKGIDGVFYDSRDLLKEIQDSYNPNTHTSELKILAPIFDVEVLVLDELGANRPTEWVQDTVTTIVNKRYNDKKITIFTSNYPVNTIAENERFFKQQVVAIADVDRKEETLADRVGQRFRSRLYEMCRLIPMSGDDYRYSLHRKRTSTGVQSVEDFHRSRKD